jgi:hypothetical protein
MKTIVHLLATTLLLACLTWAGAQANYGEFRWGLTAGANFANVSNLSEGIEKESGRTGFVGGAFCKIPLKFYLSVRPELLFNMKGATLNIPNDIVGQNLKTEFAVDYIELPISLDFDLPYFLDLHAGVQGSFLVSKKIKAEGSEVDDPNNFNSADFGWHVGAGVDIGNIGVHVRFQQSLVPFYDASLIGSGDIEPRNWGITLMAAYMFASNKL